MDRNDGGTAFPVSEELDRAICAGGSYGSSGMTLHDYAAIKFAAVWGAALAMRHGLPGYTDVAATAEAVRLGNLQADTFIAERAKERTS